MKKSELIDLLKKGLNAEERSIPIYTKHFKNSIFWTGIEEAKAEKAKQLLTSLSDGSSLHKKLVDDILKKVEANDKDAI